VRWRNPRICINARHPIADISIIRTKETEKERSPRGQSLKTCQKTGNAPFAVPVKRHLNALAKGSNLKNAGEHGANEINPQKKTQGLKGGRV
jgi:hypothetical protein